MKILSKQTVAAAAFILGVAAAPASVSVVHLSVDLDRPVVEATRPGNVIVQITLSPEAPRREVEKRPPVNLALVLDRSGSMRGEKLARAIDAIRVAVDRLNEDDFVSLTVYDHAIDVIAPAARVTAAHRRQLHGLLNEVQARGFTAIYGGIEAGAAELRKHTDAAPINRMILLSDGLANRGPSRLEDFEALAASLAEEQIIVSTIGLGMDFDEDVMAAIARAGEGNTYFVASANDLPGIFDHELGDTFSVAATEVEIIIRPRPGVRLIRGIGRDVSVENGIGRVRLPQVIGGLNKLALLEVAVPAGAAGTSQDLVEVELAYRPIEGAETVGRQMSVPVEYAETRAAVAAAVNNTVVSNVAENRLAESRLRAIAHVDRGDREAAAAELRAVRREMADGYGSLGVPMPPSVSEPLAAEADRIEQSGLSNVERKTYRSQSQQTILQQRRTEGDE